MSSFLEAWIVKISRFPHVWWSFACFTLFMFACSTFLEVWLAGFLCVRLICSYNLSKPEGYTQLLLFTNSKFEKIKKWADKQNNAELVTKLSAFRLHWFIDSVCFGITKNSFIFCLSLIEKIPYHLILEFFPHYNVLKSIQRLLCTLAYYVLSAVWSCISFYWVINSYNQLLKRSFDISELDYF